jgi:hypothetical protein
LGIFGIPSYQIWLNTLEILVFILWLDIYLMDINSSEQQLNVEI